MAKKEETEATPDPKPAAEQAPKAEGGEEKKGKGKPKAPKAPKAEAGAPAEPAKPTKSAAAFDESGKKKKKRPGHAPQRGKKLRSQLKNLETKFGKEGAADLTKAIAMLKQSKRAKFDETVEIHMKLGIDTTQSDQLVRGTVSLPHGIGKKVRVVVFCQGENVAKATEAGAEEAGSDELIKKIQGGWTDFDVALATQDMMGQVSRLGKILGPRGLMPTPKAGTVITPTGDVANAVQEFKAGKVEYRSDKSGNVHAGVGKLSFEDAKLAENVTTFVEQVRAVKPSAVRGNYVRSITLSATMSPSIPLSM